MPLASWLLYVPGMLIAIGEQPISLGGRHAG